MKKVIKLALACTLLTSICSFAAEYQCPSFDSIHKVEFNKASQLDNDWYTGAVIHDDDETPWIILFAAKEPQIQSAEEFIKFANDKIKVIPLIGPVTQKRGQEFDCDYTESTSSFHVVAARGVPPQLRF